MADIAITGKVAPVHVHLCEIRATIAAEAVTIGQAGYQAATGKTGVADANVAGKEQFRGIVLDRAGAGQETDLLEKGYVSGFDLSGVAYDGLVYLSDTAGMLSTTAGTKSVIAGRVVAMPDPALTKVLYVESRKGSANW